VPGVARGILETVGEKIYNFEKNPLFPQGYSRFPSKMSANFV